MQLKKAVDFRVFQMCPEFYTNISEVLGRFPKLAKDFRGRSDDLLKELCHGDFADFGLNCSEISGRQVNQ